ncbi:hypothetical protein [uncultured Polaribacter sp.]|uniref:hypothetical protein n=1 Tax=uncultured Polaribacter sp. TaxID=174711 RepID=UPI002616DB94|nr:hypothetical protein [uncultured Polaribacter sp.]
MKFTFPILLLCISTTLFSQKVNGTVKYQVSLNFTLQNILKEEQKPFKILKK